MVDVSNWKEFRVGDLFELKGIKQAKSQQMIPNTTRESGLPYVVQSRYNNMVSRYVDETYLTEHDEPIIDGNAIVLGVTLNACSYQKDRFGASQVITARSKQLNEFNGFFIATVLRKYVERFDYKEKPGLEKYKNLIIKLPATPDGQPDWDYMESYMKAAMEESEKSLENLKRAMTQKHLIDVSSWGEFAVTDLFDLSLPKGDLQVKQVEDGNKLLITPSAYNNGLLKRISADSESTLYSANALTVDMFGNAYYHEEDFFVTAHGHVNVLTPKEPLNLYTGTYLATAIRAMFLDKYGFSEMCTLKILKSESIHLPIDMNGEPDWRYMEDYMKRRLDEAELAVSQLQLTV